MNDAMNQESKELKRRLKKTSGFKQLVDLIRSVVINESRADFNFMKRNLHEFKRLLCSIVDEIWGSARTVIEPTLPKPVKHIRQMTGVLKLQESRNRENQLAWSSEMLSKNLRNKEEKASANGILHIKGPASFSRSIRDINKVRPPSPGPSCYFFDTLRQKSQSPRVVFPKSAFDRTSYISVSMSPGPSKYHPIIPKHP